MKRLDLALVTNVFPPEVHGGYELLAADVARVLRDRGHRVRVLTTGERSPKDHPDTSRSLYLSRSFASAARTDRARHLAASAANALAIRRFFRSAPELDGALVFSLRRLGLEPLRALQRRSLRTVVTVNDDWPLAYVRSSYEPGLGGRARALLDALPVARHTWRGLHCDRVLWLSEPLRERVLNEGAPLARGSLCAQGVDPTLFVDRGNSLANLRAPTILSVGRLHPEKGPELVIEALASLVRSGVDATLRIAGAPYTAAYGESLRALAEQLGVQRRIEWLGAVARERLPSLYAQADVFTFVSRSETEGLGLTWLEAMACATPVVAVPSGGARAFFDLHGGVERAESPDATALAAAIHRVIADPLRQRALVERGREIAARHASLDRYVDALLASFNE